MSESKTEPEPQPKSITSERESAYLAIFMKLLDSLPQDVSDALRLFAVPRWFDREFAQNTLPNSENIDEIFKRITDLSFVSSIPRGRFIIHNTVRNILLGLSRREDSAHLALEKKAYEVFIERYMAQEKMLVRPDEILLLEMIYHLLVVDPDLGQAILRKAFEEAVERYELSYAEALIDVLRERGLHQWEKYYWTWLALLRGELKAAEEHLKEIESPPPELSAYTEILKAQLLIARGGWQPGIRTLKGVIRQKNVVLLPEVVRRAEELIARGYIALALDAGSWIETEEAEPDTISNVLRGAIRILLLPLHLLIYLGLLLVDMRELSTAIARYGTSLTNLPIFDAYRRSLIALKHARATLPKGDVVSARLQVIYADLMRHIGNLDQAADLYASLVKEITDAPQGKSPLPGRQYPLGLLRDNLARVYLDKFRDTRDENYLIQAQEAAKIAAEVYETVGSELDVARTHLLHAEIAFFKARQNAKEYEVMANHLNDGLLRLEKRQDAAALLDEGLALAYRIRASRRISQETRARVNEMISRIPRKVYAVRVPGLFNYLRIISVFLPMILLIFIFLLFAGRLHSAPRMSEVTHIAEVIVTQGPIILFLTWVAAITIITLVSILAIGLATRFPMLSGLEYITVSKTHLCRYGPEGEELQCLPLDQIRQFVQVIRRTGYSVTRSWSYGIFSTSNQKMKIPATTTQYDQLMADLGGIFNLQEKPLEQIRYEVTFFYGAIVPVAFFGLAISIYLTLNRIAGLSVETHMWLAVIANALVRLMILIVMGRYIWHFVRVEQITRSRRRFLQWTLGLGVLFLMLGIPGQRETFPATIDFIFWSTLMFAGFLEEIERTADRSRALMRIVRLVVIGLMSLLVIRALVMELLVTEAFTYANAAIGAKDESLGMTSTEEELPSYYQKMRDTAVQIILINPDFADGYTYLGASAFYQLQYEDSRAAFHEAVSHNGLVVDPNLYLCEAFALEASGRPDEAQAMMSRFDDSGYCQRGFDPWCASLFPEVNYSCGP